MFYILAVLIAMANCAGNGGEADTFGWIAFLLILQVVCSD